MDQFVVFGVTGGADDAGLLVRLEEELAALVERGPVVIQVPPLVALNALGLLQLALAHSQLRGSGPALAGRAMVEALRALVASEGALAEVAARGDRATEGRTAARVVELVEVPAGVVC